jgi:hypothetical protein
MPRFDVDAYEEQQRRAYQAGCYKGRHYTTYIEEVKQLKREKKLLEAEKLLLKLIKVVEEQAEIDGGGVAPGWYGHLAIVYRRMGEPARADAINQRLDEQRQLDVERKKKAEAQYMRD